MPQIHRLEMKSKKFTGRLNKIILFISLCILAFGCGEIKKVIGGNVEVTRYREMKWFNVKLLKKIQFFDSTEQVNLRRGYIDLIPFYVDKKQGSGIILYTTRGDYNNRTPLFVKYENGGDPYCVFIVIQNKKVLLFKNNNSDSNRIFMNELKSALPTIPDSITSQSCILNNLIFVDE